MTVLKLKQITIIWLAFVLSFATSAAWSCTSMQVKAKDGSVVNGRSVEFDMNLALSGLIIPRGYPFKGTLPDGGTGMVYHAKYAAIGGSMFGEPAMADGLNEKGLSVAALYFPGYAGYAQLTPQNKSQALSPTEFTNWLLTQFATLDEVKEGLKSVVIAPTIPKGWPILPPLHYVVYDKSGKSIVIEPVKGKLIVYDNPIGVMTNSPSFDWHLTNLTNYINLSPVNAPPVTIDNFKLQQLGSGSGMHGLPGDFTPPSRFVRAAVFSASAIPVKDSAAAVFQIFHLLNQFDIPVGTVRSENNAVVPEYTLATTVKDPQTLTYYFRTFDDQSIKMASLKSFDLNAKKIKTFSMQGMQTVQDIAASAK